MIACVDVDYRDEEAVAAACCRAPGNTRHQPEWVDASNASSCINPDSSPP
jgi:hypothetical protein